MTLDIASIIWVIGIVAWAAIRRPYRSKAKRTKVIADKKSTTENLALVFCTIGLVIIPLAHLLTPVLRFANYEFSPLLAYLGTISMIGFLIFFYFSHKHLARNWSVTLEIREDHKLVQHGVYKYIRHPMYTSFWLWGISQFLLIPNWIAGTTGIASIAWLYFSRIDKEEAMMQAQFNDEYTQYCTKTSRLWPKLF
ncbi:MAG: protein-S-isoprenylcysteine O-methyltransferase [Rhizobiaceae bacterium]